MKTPIGPNGVVGVPVYILPLRNENSRTKDNISDGKRPVYILPLRNENDQKYFSFFFHIKFISYL